jgi:hypothetical protein|tara:strand:+ start:1046 stop:1243 length:198 start_codon:yes stop_codon:yes gene_type:complete
MTNLPRQKMTKRSRHIFGACLRYRVAGSLGELGAGQATVTASRGAVTTLAGGGKVFFIYRFNLCK